MHTRDRSFPLTLMDPHRRAPSHARVTKLSRCTPTPRNCLPTAPTRLLPLLRGDPGTHSRLPTGRFHCILEKKGAKWCVLPPIPRYTPGAHPRVSCRMVEDQGSTNGVYVDEVKVKTATELKEGTVVCFGAPEYRYLVK
jgi:hypothetical protein